MSWQRQCDHAELQYETSPYAAEAGFIRPQADRRLAATARSGRNPLAGKGVGERVLKELVSQSAAAITASFPGPLVLPDDHLAVDPKDPPQSLRSWLLEGERNKPTKQRSTLYVACAPEITASVRHMKAWSEPKLPKGKKARTTAEPFGKISPLSSEDVMEYVAAFYHGLKVESFPERLRFVPWSEKGSANEKYVGLALSDRCTRIRVRASPDGLFGGQLNLEDVLDAAIEMLPKDAYAMVLLTDHDLYEDEEDDFCCGRAYGGSRVCVVSSARYHPVLDESGYIDVNHMWPNSHCTTYIQDLCRQEGMMNMSTDLPVSGVPKTSPIAMRAAVHAATATGSIVSHLRGLWFSRLARTAVHELGHCLGMDHCNYYACVMQSTASMAEDVRQPPYLCPVCLSKITHAISYELQAHAEDDKHAYMLERYQALVEVCDKWASVGMFAGYGAWLQIRIQTISNHIDGQGGH